MRRSSYAKKGKAEISEEELGKVAGGDVVVTYDDDTDVIKNISFSGKKAATVAGIVGLPLGYPGPDASENEK